MAKKKVVRPVSNKDPLAPRPLPDAGPMDVALLERLMTLMAHHDVNNLEVSEGNRRISLQRGGMLLPAPAAAPAPRPAPIASDPAPAPTAPAPAPAGDADLVPIKSPMVGTFYASPSPDAKPFVSVGSVVDDETDVCVIEAMKVFNNIKAEVRGTIARVCVENAKPVEFGTVLFLVKK